MDIDRVAPTRRPPGVAIGHQRWRDLLFLHWPTPPGALRSRVPAALAIDTFDGAAYIGLVAFALEGLRLRGVPEMFSLAFLEVNVRTYVHVNGADPGVYFFSLDAASRFAVIAARATFGLPYYYARMQLNNDGPQIEYSAVRLQRSGPGAFLKARCEAGEALGPAEPGTLDHFLLERYLLHVERSGRIVSARIHHGPYPRQRAHILSLDESLVATAGVARPAGPAPIVHYAAGVDVELFAPRRRSYSGSG